MNKHDIVNAEAFKLVKKDFIDQMDHNQDKITDAFGIENNPEIIEEFINKWLKENSTTRALQHILEKSKNLNEFCYFVFVFSAMKNEVEEKMKFIDLMGKLEGILGKFPFIKDQHKKGENEED